MLDKVTSVGCSEKTTSQQHSPNTNSDENSRDFKHESHQIEKLLTPPLPFLLSPVF